MFGFWLFFFFLKGQKEESKEEVERMSPVLPNVFFRDCSLPASAGSVPPVSDKYEEKNIKVPQMKFHGYQLSLLKLPATTHLKNM